MAKITIICCYFSLALLKLAIAEIDKANIKKIEIPICASSEVQKSFVFNIESLDAHSSNLKNLENSKTLEIGLIVGKLRSFARSELLFETSPSYSNRIFKNTNNRVVIHEENIEIATITLQILPAKQVYWEVVFDVHGGFGDRHLLKTVMFLDGFIPSRVNMKKPTP